MRLVKGRFYRIVFDVGGRALSFNCEITHQDDDYVTFIDKFGKTISYRKDTIISIENSRMDDDAFMEIDLKLENKEKLLEDSHRLRKASGNQKVLTDEELIIYALAIYYRVLKNREEKQ